MLAHLSKFLQVGGVGFAIDAGLLWFLIYELGINPIVSRGVSFLFTISVTFILNARYTFVVDVKSASMPRYLVIQLVGAGINFVSYSWLVLEGPLNQRPLVALVIGSALASAHNFIMMRRYVFN